MVKPLYSVFRECRHSKKFCQLIYKNNQTDSTHSESCFFFAAEPYFVDFIFLHFAATTRFPSRLKLGICHKFP
jgi:hypothetical protein